MTRRPGSLPSNAPPPKARGDWDPPPVETWAPSTPAGGLSGSKKPTCVLSPETGGCCFQLHLLSQPDMHRALDFLSVQAPWPHCTSQTPRFCRLKVCGTPVSSKAISAIHPTALFYFIIFLSLIN